MKPKRKPLAQLNLSKYFETKTKDKKIISNAKKNPHIHGPKINSEIKPSSAIINTDKRSAVLEKSNMFLTLIKL